MAAVTPALAEMAVNRGEPGAQFLVLGASAASAFAPASGGSALDSIIRQQGSQPAAPVRTQTAVAYRAAVKTPAEAPKSIENRQAYAPPALSPFFMRASLQQPQISPRPERLAFASVSRPFSTARSFETVGLTTNTSFANLMSLRGASTPFASRPWASAVAAPAVTPAVWHPAEPAIRRKTGPDFFGSIAMPVNGTALDARWRRAAQLSLPKSGLWIEAVQSAGQSPDLEQINAVNRWVNRAITFESDATLYGQRDHWATASESLTRGRGDCEDYAIAKMQLLRAAGVPARDLFLVVVKDTLRRQDHAVLVVRQGDVYWTLDSGSDVVLSEDEVRDYRPVVTYSAAGGAWVHGYRQTPNIVLAANGRLAPAAQP